MGDILKLVRRRKTPWDGITGITPRKRSPLPFKIIGGALAGLVIGTAIAILPVPDILSDIQSAIPLPSRFGLCHTGGGTNCVVDGDTFWMDGQRVRMADIDAPETHPPRCALEADLGRQATRRLRELLNEGPVQLQSIGRDQDQYGRLLRIVTRDGRSLGMTLVEERLARRWTGSRQPWC